jgi:hypothetical protein
VPCLYPPLSQPMPARPFPDPPLDPTAPLDDPPSAMDSHKAEQGSGKKGGNTGYGHCRSGAGCLGKAAYIRLTAKCRAEWISRPTFFSFPLCVCVASLLDHDTRICPDSYRAGKVAAGAVIEVQPTAFHHFLSCMPIPCFLSLSLSLSSPLLFSPLTPPFPPSSPGCGSCGHWSACVYLRGCSPPRSSRWTPWARALPPLLRQPHTLLQRYDTPQIES